MKADPVLTADAPEIPDKLYFRIGDVSRLAGVKPFVLRFWETEFPQLSPKKSGTGHRLYRRKDVEMVLEIKRLLYEERFTIEGARNTLAARHGSGGRAQSKALRKPKPAPLPVAQGELFGGIPPAAWNEVRAELRALLDLLARKPD